MTPAADFNYCAGRRHFDLGTDATCKARIGCAQYAAFQARAEFMGVPVAMHLMDDQNNCHYRREAKA